MSILAEGAKTTSETLAPFFVGGTILAVFVLLVLGVLAFGKGREHT